MQRRHALTLAATIGGTVFAATAALAVNLGIVSDASSPTADPVTISDVLPAPVDPVPATPPVTVIIEEAPAPAVAAASPASSVATPTAPTFVPFDDHGGDRDDMDDDHSGHGGDDDDDRDDDHSGHGRGGDDDDERDDDD